MTTENPSERQKQPWNVALVEYKQLRFLQYFCGFENTPANKNVAEVPSDFNAVKTKTILYEYITSLHTDYFKVVYGNNRIVPEPEVLRSMLIDHYGLKEGEVALSYEEISKKYKIREAKIGQIFRLVLDKIKEHSTF